MMKLGKIVCSHLCYCIIRDVMENLVKRQIIVRMYPNNQSRRPSQHVLISTLGIIAHTLSTSRYSDSVSCRSRDRRSSSFIDTSCFRLRMFRWQTHASNQILPSTTDAT